MCEHTAVSEAKVFFFFFFFFLSALAARKERLINHSALLGLHKGSVITWGTHFEETKLVASTAGRPVPESMSISWIFTPVGTIS